MRLAPVSIPITALLAAVTVVAQAHPDFSGTWVLNRAKSSVSAQNRLADPAEGEAQNLVLDVEQTAGQVTITRRGGAAEPIILAFDGREIQSKGPRGGNVTSRSHWEDRVLVTETARDVTGKNGPYTVKVRDERFLSEDGRVLTLKSRSTTPRGTIDRVLVFDKRE